jgi:hypothetical protein
MDPDEMSAIDQNRVETAILGGIGKGDISG